MYTQRGDLVKYILHGDLAKYTLHGDLDQCIHFTMI
jgi:hypothetical protein